MFRYYVIDQEDRGGWVALQRLRYIKPKTYEWSYFSVTRSKFDYFGTCSLEGILKLFEEEGITHLRRLTFTEVSDYIIKLRILKELEK